MAGAVVVVDVEVDVDVDATAAAAAAAAVVGGTKLVSRTPRPGLVRFGQRFLTFSFI